MTHTLLPAEKLSPVLWVRRFVEGGAYYYHWCPGCKHAHSYAVGVSGGRPNWRFNGNVEKPSFNPSMLIYSGGWQRADGTKVPRRTHCHYYVTDGEIRFQGDSPHEFSGKTLPLEPIPEDYGL